MPGQAKHLQLPSNDPKTRKEIGEEEHRGLAIDRQEGSIQSPPEKIIINVSGIDQGQGQIIKGQGQGQRQVIAGHLHNEEREPSAGQADPFHNLGLEPVHPSSAGQTAGHRLFDGHAARHRGAVPGQAGGLAQALAAGGRGARNA
jgi:hypothetical protein